jgi:hypothetical protein
LRRLLSIQEQSKRLLAPLEYASRGENWRQVLPCVTITGIAEAGVEGGPRVGTRVERAEEGRCEGEEGLRARTDVNVHAIFTKPTRSRLVRLSGLCRRSPMVYHRAGIWMENCMRTGEVPVIFLQLHVLPSE